jgi:signal transduction histidine kinase
MKELSERNQRLYEANTKLLEHAQVVEELVTSRERNRFASEIHDSVGHSLSVLGALLEVCKLTFNEDSEATYEKISTALSISKSTLYELREAVVNFSSPSVKGTNLLDSIKSMVLGFESTGIRVNFIAHGNMEFPLHEKIPSTVFNICREALTNALKHGEANEVDIILQFNKENIGLFIFDDGKGCTNINKGMGLKGMENRVQQLNGSISFGSGGETGFGIHVQIPFRD